MNLEQIKSLVSVVNHKSFSLAAKEMFVSQPTISMHIKTLEKELGEQLLIRSTKDIVLSEAGLLFYPYAVQMLKAEEDAIQKIKNKGEKLVGDVMVASSSVPANHIFPGFLAYSKKKNPDIGYKISEGGSTEVLQKILHFEQEIGVGSIRSSSTKLFFEPLIEDEIVLITPNIKKYRDYKGNFDRNKLKRENFVIREMGSGTKVAADNVERKLGLESDKVQIAAEVQTTETLKRVVAEGVGIGFVSSLAVKDYLEQKRVLVFEFPEIETKRQLYLFWHCERNLSKVGERAISMLKEYCSQI